MYFVGLGVDMVLTCVNICSIDSAVLATTDRSKAMQITMSVSSRIFMLCQLDNISMNETCSEYGLTRIPCNGRRGYWFAGPEAAWRKLANDVDYRRDSGWSRDCRTRKSDGLHGRIDKHLAKANNIG